jgi:hypothetical protein
MNWEYQVLEIQPTEGYQTRMVQTLNTAGAAGWELVSTVMYAPSALSLFMKRTARVG